MSITNETEMAGMQAAGNVVAHVLKAMREYAQPGMTTFELDQYGGQLMQQFGANSAPFVTYKFPGYTCISVNNEVAHGVPGNRVLRDGDLVNVDVSAEYQGFWADNGGSFVLGTDINGHNKLVEASKDILRKAIDNIRGGVKISDIGHLIETESKKRGYKVIRNLTGHGIGRALHEAPSEIANFRDRFNFERFRKNSVVAIETFIATRSSYANSGADGWTLTGDRGGFVAQHEHTIMVTDGKPYIFTAANEIWA